jgi:hypothetical protein
MKKRSLSQSILTGLFLLLVLAVSNCISHAQTCPPSTTTNWVGTPTGSGEFFDPANWSAGCRPNGGTNAFVNGGVISTFDPNVSPNAYVHILVLGANQGDSGSVKVDQSSFVRLQTVADCRVEGEAPAVPSPYLGGDMYIGRKGKGTLDISNGNLVIFSSAFIAAVENTTKPASSGVVTVSGGATFRAFGPCVGNQLCVGCDRIPDDGGSTDSGGTGSLIVKDPGVVEVYNDNPASPGIKVGRSGTLSGGGIVKLLAQLDPCSDCQTAKVLGTVAPSGQLTIQGNLDLSASSASAVVHVKPAGADNINVINVTQDSGFGQVTLGGRLTVIISGTFNQGQTFTLLHADGGRLNGSTFASTSIIDNGTGCYVPTIVYDDVAHNVNLYFEPRDRCN